MFLYYIPFSLACLFSALGRKSGTAYFLLACMLIAMCALQAPGVSEDHSNYIDYFSGVASGSLDAFFIEPTFYFLSQVSIFLSGSSELLFLVYAVLGVGIKFLVSKRVSGYYWFSVALYISYFFFLQDFTQIRIGAAVAFIFLSSFSFYSGQRLRALLFFLIAVLFHYSTAIFLPFFVFFYFNSIRTVLMLYLLCCFLFLFYMFDLSLSQGLVDFFSILQIDRLSFYLENALSGQGGSINPMRALFHFIMLTPLVFLFDKIKRESAFLSYSIIIHLCGLIILLSLHDLQVFAYRISDIFNGFMIFSLISYIVIFGRRLGGALVLGVAVFQLVYILLVLEFVNPYTSVLGDL
ncbi:EpsG family protein [Pseudomonas chlororaphis]|nr:EpsG family protein [Pseudomonas chlororaphis]